MGENSLINLTLANITEFVYKMVQCANNGLKHHDISATCKSAIQTCGDGLVVHHCTSIIEVEGPSP